MQRVANPHPARSTTGDTNVGTWLGLICAEYRESPGLQLTLSQARRFWGLDDVVSAALFGALVDAGFLKRTQTGVYVMADGN